MFPYIMIFVTVIFFSEKFHLKLIHFLRSVFNNKSLPANEVPLPLHFSPGYKKMVYPLLMFYIVGQVFDTISFFALSGKLYWTEEGYRFSWRVMLMEKGGTAFFYVKDPLTGRKGEVVNAQFLTPLQERMMETQPDMMLQYAHYLHDVYKNKGIKDPIVTVESYVTLNGSNNQLYIDSTIDLSKQQESFFTKKMDTSI